MTDYFLGEIRLLGFNNRVPRDFALCNGQLMNIAGNEALYAVIGTTYGGNGTTSFGLPDLRGRLPIGVGQGTGLSNYMVGQTAGVETVTVGVGNIPAHTHVLSVSKNGATGKVPGPAVVQGDVGAGELFYCAQSQAGTQQTFASDTISASTNSYASPGAHLNVQPTMGLVYVICINGLFPIHS